MISTQRLLLNQGKVLNGSDAHFGQLRESTDLYGDARACQARMQEDGYLFFRGVLDRDEVLDARRELLEMMRQDGYLHPDAPLMDGGSHPENKIAFRAEYAMASQALKKVVYGDNLMAFYRRLLGAEVRAFDFRWLRAVSGGLPGINPHCDVVYMGRGTHNLFTAWIPYGDTPMEMGTLAILENSHRHADKLRHYISRDVDSYCKNTREAADIEAGRVIWPKMAFGGALSNDCLRLRSKLGGRWLSADFRAGDFITFGMVTVHASLDNQTDRVRLSSDTRYQRADEPVDERWVGENPIGHGLAGKQGRIC